MARVKSLGQFWPWRARQDDLPIHAGDPLSAQEVYKQMIDSEISPALRRLGMKGSAGRYALPSTTHWALLGFQKSAYSDRQTIRFTVNLCVVSRDFWEHEAKKHPYYGKRPSAGAYGTASRNERIGNVAGQGDTWWLVRAGSDTVPISTEVVGVIEAFALPWLRARME